MKINRKQLNGYLMAKRELWGISFNDAYNITEYGITKGQYDKISKAVYNLSGICGEFPSLTEINKELDLIKV